MNPVLKSFAKRMGSAGTFVGSVSIGILFSLLLLGGMIIKHPVIGQVIKLENGSANARFHVSCNANQQGRIKCDLAERHKDVF